MSTWYGCSKNRLGSPVPVSVPGTCTCSQKTGKLVRGTGVARTGTMYGLLKVCDARRPPGTSETLDTVA